MISNAQNHLLSQMQALEAMASASAVAARSEPEPPRADFAALMRQAVGEVNQAQMNSASMSRSFELGEPVDLAEVMIAMQKSRVSFEALLQVRNKLLSAYQDVMNMSV